MLLKLKKLKNEKLIILNCSKGSKNKFMIDW